jgi:transposase
MQNHILSKPERDFVEIENEITAGVYSTSVQVVKWIKETFEIEYSERGVQRILRKLGFVYKKTTVVPCKADFVEQKRKKSFISLFIQILRS